jgi:integrase
MDELILDEKRLEDIGDFMSARKYSISSWNIYMGRLVQLAKKYKKIDKEIAFKYLQKSNNPNQTAVISLLNEYCVYRDIDFYLRKIKVIQKPRKVPKVLSLEEIRKLVEKMPMPYSLMVKCLFGIGGGLRIGDIVVLNWDNFDWTGWFQDRTKYGLVLLKKRKRNKELVQNVYPALMEELFNFAKSQDILNEDGEINPGLVFNFGAIKFKPKLRDEDKDMWTFLYRKHATAQVQYQFKKYGFTGVHTHTFRHSKGSYLFNVLGLPIEQVKEIMGHEKADTTLIYAHLSIKKIFDKVQDAEVI